MPAVCKVGSIGSCCSIIFFQSCSVFYVSIINTMIITKISPVEDPNAPNQKIPLYRGDFVVYLINTLDLMWKYSFAEDFASFHGRDR